MEFDFKRAAREVLLAAVAGAAFYLFAAALFAIIVKAYAPSQGVVTAVNWTLKALASFVFSLIFVRSERALFKGIAAGICSCVLAMLLFAAIGGGFHLTALFLVELLLSGVMGGVGALFGTKLRKEE